MICIFFQKLDAEILKRGWASSKKKVGDADPSSRDTARGPMTLRRSTSPPALSIAKFREAWLYQLIVRSFLPRAGCRWIDNDAAQKYSQAGNNQECGVPTCALDLAVDDGAQETDSGT